MAMGGNYLLSIHNVRGDRRNMSRDIERDGIVLLHLYAGILLGLSTRPDTPPDVKQLLEDIKKGFYKWKERYDGQQTTPES